MQAKKMLLCVKPQASSKNIGQLHTQGAQPSKLLTKRNASKAVFQLFGANKGPSAGLARLSTKIACVPAAASSRQGSCQVKIGEIRCLAAFFRNEISKQAFYREHALALKRRIRQIHRSRMRAASIDAAYSGLRWGARGSSIQSHRPSHCSAYLSVRPGAVGGRSSSSKLSKLDVSSTSLSRGMKGARSCLSASLSQSIPVNQW